ncbi:hypothetical protein DFH29DRAFT_1084743 [Suillus ampliporus]|nr:hypothetical protein DFH29DRAFT_1084743 [Suillus ampliporus]
MVLLAIQPLHSTSTTSLRRRKSILTMLSLKRPFSMAYSYTRKGAKDDGPTWEQTPVTNLKLSALERMHRTKDRSTAIKLLHRRINLSIDSDLKFATDDPKLLLYRAFHQRCLKGRTMPPKKKTAAETTNETAQTSNAFRMDTRPVEAMAPKYDVAGEVQALDKRVAEARIGIGMVNILEMENPLIFGMYNDRPQKMTEVNKMIASFEVHGIQAMKEDNALAIIIDRKRLSTHQTFGGDWHDGSTLTHVRFQDLEPLVLASGQHRVAALRKYAEAQAEDLEHAMKKLERLQEIANPTEVQVAEHAELRESTAELKGTMERNGKWGVILYDRDILLKDGPVLARHLSRNKTLHVYNETPEELLVSTLRNMQDAYHRDGEAAALKVYTEYMNYEMDILRWLASKDVFPTYEEINSLINRAKEGGPNAAALMERFDELRAALLKGHPGDPTIFTKLVPEIDEAAAEAFARFKGPMDTYNDDYVAAIGTYRGKVTKILRNAWTSRQQSDRAEADKVWLDSVTARVCLWLVPVEGVHVPMPLMTGTVMDNAWKSLEDVSEGMKECSRWFEPLIDTHRINCPNSHTIDDATESIFRVIERTPDIDTDQAVSNVWSSLWRSRTTSVLRLHNMMSTADTQALMNSRPADKKAFKKEWERAPEDSKQSAQALYNLIKPRAGKGPQSMPPSSMKLPGMPA